MKKYIFPIVVILALTAAILFASYELDKSHLGADTKHISSEQQILTNSIIVDTLDIRGQKHEMIYIKESAKTVGITHSPECWCHKDTISVK